MIPKKRKKGFISPKTFPKMSYLRYRKGGVCVSISRNMVALELTVASHISVINVGLTTTALGHATRQQQDLNVEAPYLRVARNIIFLNLVKMY